MVDDTNPAGLASEPTSTAASFKIWNVQHATPHTLVTYTHSVWTVKLKHWIAMNTTRGETEANILRGYKMDMKRS